MNLKDQFFATTRAFADGATTVDDLQAWLAGHVQALANGGDRELEALANDAWFLLDDYAHGRITLDDLRSEVRELAEASARLQAAPTA